MSGQSHPFISGRSVNRRSAFTLVEMLAVMGIIVIMLLATLPAFKGFNQSENRRGAVGAVMGTLDRARMMAITDGLATYVVFAQGTKVNTALWGRAYAIFQDSDNVNFNVVQRTPWMYLPTGVAFKVNTDIRSITNRELTSTDPYFPILGSALPANSSGGVTAQLPYWKFDSTGTVDQQTNSDYLRVLLFPGYVDGNGKEFFTQNSASSNGTKTNVLLSEIDVNQATGRAKYTVDPLNNLTPSPPPTP